MPGNALFSRTGGANPRLENRLLARSERDFIAVQGNSGNSYYNLDRADGGEAAVNGGYGYLCLALADSPDFAVLSDCGNLFVACAPFDIGVRRVTRLNGIIEIEAFARLNGFLQNVKLDSGYRTNNVHAAGAAERAVLCCCRNNGVTELLCGNLSGGGNVRNVIVARLPRYRLVCCRLRADNSRKRGGLADSERH